MLLIGGFLIVVGSVTGGYLMAGGKLYLLLQPSEFVIIGGAALGAMLIGTPMATIKKLLGQIKGAASSGLSQADFADLLSMMYQLFRLQQQTGIMALEPHFENPQQSNILSKYPKFMERHHSLAFLSDTIKVIIVGGMSSHDLEALMDEDLHTHHEVERGPSATLRSVADSLPGLGIVAAVLGIVITMQSIDGPPSEIGHHVGAALVGTFLGVLLAYGFVQPLAARIEQKVADDGKYEVCMKAGIMAMFKGAAPAIAIEFARRTLPEEVRPSFEDAERLCRASRGTDTAAAAAQQAA